ncbi:MAG: hypothetical protein GY696_10340 [Gammaproteobacteria bacterium]|nr:hypothetical protein [Gammaproteobacteria bacterium]
MLMWSRKFFLTRVVNFGEKTAGTMAVTALRWTAEIFGDQTINGVKSDVVTDKDMKLFREKLRRDDFKNSEEEITYLPKIPNNSEKSTGLGGEVIKLFQASASAKLLTDMHIDDWPTGGNKILEVREMVDEASKIIEYGGFQFKAAVFSGDQSGEMKVLGVSWNPATNQLKIDLNANVHEKKNGLKTGPAIDFSDVNSSMPQDVHRYSS